MMKDNIWKNTPPPKDRMIMRWHKFWKCPVAVFWTNQGIIIDECPWISGTRTNTWPERAFSPEWAECPQPPIEQVASEKLKGEH
jgi:hypothetical protein